MIRIASFFVPLGLVLTLAACPAQADIRLTLSNNGSAFYSNTFNGNSGSYFVMNGFSFTFETSIDNNPGTGNLGMLSTTLQYSPTAGTNSFTVDVQETNAFTSPLNPPSYNVEDRATLNSVATTLSGSANFNNLTNVAPVTVSGLNTATNSAVVPTSNGYKLGHSFTLTNLTVGSPILATLMTSVLSGPTPAAVPEPSSLVLTALTAVGLGGIGLRRSRRGATA